MPATPLRPTRFVLAAAAAVVALAGCSTVDGYTHSFANAITPYKVEVVQGNFVSREQVAALKPGMSRDEVRNVLGTPLVVSLFRGERWDYVFTLKRQRVEPQKRHLTVFFQGDRMERVEGDPMPSEAEFVATIDAKRNLGGKVPQLEATEAQLQAFQAKNPPAPEPQPAPAAPATPKTYPPLESATR
jgi:outer membrane protein assembly factor BamE